MAKFTNPLDGVRVAARCSAEWDRMFAVDGDRVRFCSQCNLNVYNFSSMTKTEAEDLLNRTEGRLCARFYRRSDGTVLTQNCPVGLKALKRRVAWVAQLLLGMVVSLLSGLGIYGLTPTKTIPSFLRGLGIADLIPLKQKEEPVMVMGDISVEVPDETEKVPPPRPNGRR